MRRTVDGADDIFCFCDVPASLSGDVSEGVVYAVLLKEEVYDVCATEGSCEMEGGRARAGRVHAVWGNGAMG